MHGIAFAHRPARGPQIGIALSVRRTFGALLLLALAHCRMQFTGKGRALGRPNAARVARSPYLANCLPVAAVHAASEVGEQLAPAGAVPAALASREAMQLARL